MNRAERRRNKVTQPPPKMKHMTEKAYWDEINKAYRKGWDNAFEKASNIAVGYMLAIPLLVLHERFGEVRLKECDGKSRIEHFFDMCTEIFDEYNSGSDTLTKLINDVEEKTGFNISERLFVGDDRE